MKGARVATRGGSWALDNCTVVTRRRRIATTRTSSGRTVAAAIVEEGERRADRLVKLEREWKAAIARADRDESRRLAAEVGALRRALGENRPMVVELDYVGETWATRK